MQWTRQSVFRRWLFRHRKSVSLPPQVLARSLVRFSLDQGVGQLRQTQLRLFSLSSIPTLLLPSAVFTGLLVTLWTYKCMMMVVFQNKIIYMPSMPPFSRSEKVEDYINACKPVEWVEISIRSLDGTKLKLLEGSIPPIEATRTSQKHVVILYLQGNASSLPPRLPHLANTLKMLYNSTADVQYSIVALSYRGYWQSSGRANQKGIELDAQATLQWLAKKHGAILNTRVVLWGQSIGAGVATTALATWLHNIQGTNAMRISGLLLETPFTSLNAMLISLYPQKFLPYRYLGPFLQSTWDSERAFQRIGESLSMNDRENEVEDNSQKLKVLLLEAADDELVPKGDAARLLEVCRISTGIDAVHKTVQGALHTNVMMKSEGKREIVRFLRSFE